MRFWDQAKISPFIWRSYLSHSIQEALSQLIFTARYNPDHALFLHIGHCRHGTSRKVQYG